ncbi:MAG: aldo/keto reductase [Cytophagales bacterium]|nr:aldo/keto reductase [Rhizobacter sp.]
MRHLELPDATPLPVLGLGTWRMGEDKATRTAEIASVRSAIELGYRLIDTAEMYGEGGAETVVGQALAEAFRAGAVRREAMCVVSKVYPHNASQRGTAEACERSLKRLGLDQIDLYLLHWRGAHPLAETVAAMESLVHAGKIRNWGVSNLDLDDMQELEALQASRCATNQVYYSLTQRGPEFSLLPWLRERAMPLMAYSPIDQGSLAGDDTLATIGQVRGLTAAQVALAWVVSQPGVVAIPKASSVQHLQDNLAAESVSLNADELKQIDARFPPPKRKTQLSMI